MRWQGTAAAMRFAAKAAHHSDVPAFGAIRGARRRSSGQSLLATWCIEPRATIYAWPLGKGQVSRLFALRLRRPLFNSSIVAAIARRSIRR